MNNLVAGETASGTRIGHVMAARNLRPGPQLPLARAMQVSISTVFGAYVGLMEGMRMIHP